MSTTATDNALTADAKNRALRALLIALAVAVFVDVWPVVRDALSGHDPLAWGELGKAALRTGMLSAGSFLKRRVLDPSRVATPLPPAPMALPEEDLEALALAPPAGVRLRPLRARRRR